MKKIFLLLGFLFVCGSGLAEEQNLTARQFLNLSMDIPENLQEIDYVKQPTDGAIFENSDKSQTIMVMLKAPEFDGYTPFEWFSSVYEPKNIKERIRSFAWKRGLKNIKRFEKKRFEKFYAFITTTKRNKFVHDYNIFNYKNEWMLTVGFFSSKEDFLSFEEADRIVSSIQWRNP